MRKTALILALTMLAPALVAMGQEPVTPSNMPPQGNSAPTGMTTHAKKKKQEVHLKPFSRLAVSGGVGLGGINVQAATNVNRYLNVRGTGNIFDYTVNNITVSNFNVNGKVNFATGGVALDYFPFPSHGFRLSPGVLFYNQNQITATGVGTAGSSISLNSIKYYSETADPLALNAALGLNTRKQAATLTTGWGNMIPRKGGHWAFPFEFGAAFTGVPGISLGLTGYGCTTQSDAAIYTGAGGSCVNMATNTTAQNNINAQVTKWQSDLNALQVYPIVSFGVSYSFPIR